jgi:hypothetical protein
MSEAQSDGVLPWSGRQRQTLLWLTALLLAALGGRYACQRAFLDDPAPDVAARAGELADKLDPNIAGWRELSAIPGLGPKKAQAIVAFRKQWVAHHPGKIPFRSPTDLRQVKGIGSATVSSLAPYLAFSAVQPPGTRP